MLPLCLFKISRGNALSHLSRRFIGSSWTCEEIHHTIKMLSLHKSPGPDGLPYNYYKKFSEQLVPHMALYVNCLWDGGIVPVDENKA